MNRVPGSRGQGTMRRIPKQPRMSTLNDNASVVRYRTMSPTIEGNAYSLYARFMVPGLSGALNSNTVGPGIVANYSTGVFKPGTRCQWLPSVSFNTTGRVYVGFTDNPEAAAALNTLANSVVSSPTYGLYADAVKSLGNLITFPVWAETDISIPLKLRRKRFDVNANLGSATSDILDRCMQTSMWVAFEGFASGGTTSLGTFLFDEVVDVEGITGIVT